MNGRRMFICRAGLVLLLVAARAAWAAKLSQAEVEYRDRANGSKDCDDCMHFIAGGTPSATGSCKVVAGPISPHGYCLAFTPKPSG